MPVYTVLRPRVGAGLKALDRTVFLSDKFCWPAFIFGPFWLLWRRIWLTFILTLVAIILLLAAIFWFDWLRSGGEWIYVAIAAYLGFEAPRLREAALSRRGFLVDGVIVAANKPDAESEYFHRLDWTEPAAPAPVAPAAAPPPHREPEVVGLFPQPNRPL